MEILTDNFVVPIPFDVVVGKTGHCLTGPPGLVVVDKIDVFAETTIFFIGGRVFDLSNLGKVVIEKNGETTCTIRFFYLEIEKKEASVMTNGQ